MPKNINCIAINITLESLEKVKQKKVATKKAGQSREHLQVEWLLFPMKMHNRWLAQYEILPFEFSKIIEDKKGKIDKAYS